MEVEWIAKTSKDCSADLPKLHELMGQNGLRRYIDGFTGFAGRMVCTVYGKSRYIMQSRSKYNIV